MPANMFITLQGKGGIGKSYCTSAFAQYMLARGQTVICIDTDAINPTLLRYGPLKAQHLKLSENHIVDPRAIDKLIEILKAAPDDASVVVDVGSNGFETLMGYEVENGLFDFLQERGHSIYAQTVIAGGADAEETIKGTMSLLNATGVPMLLWFNEHMGPLEYQGRSLMELDFLHAASARIIGNVKLTSRTRQTFGRDIEEMLSRRLTFDEAQACFELMPSNRIKRVRDDIYAQLDEIGFLSAD